MKKLLNVFLIAFCSLFLMVSCDKKTTTANKELKSRLLDYESESKKTVGLNSWYAPVPTDENYKEYSDAGFDWIFLNGNNVGSMGDAKIESALEYCNKYGIDAFVDCGNTMSDVFSYTKYLNYESFKGFNIDEPILDGNTVNGKQGIREISQYIESYNDVFPDKCFLVNQNPFDCFFVFGNVGYDYDELISTTYELLLEKVPTDLRWLSADSYVLKYNESGKKKNIMLDTWLYQLDLMASFKAINKELKTNMFIQSMAYNPGHFRPVISKEDIKMQLYCCLAFNFDMISYFCYQSPTNNDRESYGPALIDVDGNKTVMYDYAKELNKEIKSLSAVTMQFDNWIGAYCGFGSENLKEDEFYDNKNLVLKNALKIKNLGEIQEISALEDYLITFSKDRVGNCGYMVVNYNETTENLSNTMTITFKNALKAVVYQNGEKKTIDLKNHQLTLDLGVGDGAFVIPDFY